MRETFESLTERAQRLRQELEEVETLIRLARKYNFGNDPKPVSSALQLLQERMTVVGAPARKPKSQRQRIIEAADMVLSDGRRRLSRELLPELTKLGVIVGGKDPSGNLAAYLSREKERFHTDQKRGGWTLTRMMQKARPADVVATAGLFTNGRTA